MTELQHEMLPVLHWLEVTVAAGAVDVTVTVTVPGSPQGVAAARRENANMA